VVIPQNLDEAMSAARAMLDEGKFGDAGRRIVVEEFLRGEELSVLAVTDGRTIAVLEPAQDSTRIFDGDQGPNTGGMGTYSPAPVFTYDLVEQVRHRLAEPALKGIAKEGAPYRDGQHDGMRFARDTILRILDGTYKPEGMVIERGHP